MKKLTKVLVALLFSMLTAMTISPTIAIEPDNLQVVNLQCEGIVKPLGIDVAKPSLSWNIESSDRDTNQSAYQIIASSSFDAVRGNHGDLWDSGKIDTDQTIAIRYDGKRLSSGEIVYWKVRAWDRRGNSSWSQPSEWVMGIVNPEDWHASWIAAPTNPKLSYETLLARHTFFVKPKLLRATAFVCGLGQYEMYINGHKVGNDVLAPGWTNYKKTCLYDTRDITRLLKPGSNSVGLLLGNGMYNVYSGGRYYKFTGSFGPLKAICLIRLEYADGTNQEIGTDSSWKIAPGPITFSGVYGGEDYDARLVQDGWDEPQYDDGQWVGATECDGPGGTLKGATFSAPQIGTFESFTPKSVTPIRAGVAVYDLGQNASFMPKLTVHGIAGSSVTITPAELLNADGTVDRQSSGGGEAYWKYTLAGVGEETYFPKFFYHGCRYLQVQLAAPAGEALPIVDSLKGVVVGSIAPAVGDFQCSNELFNKIYSLVRWAQRSNMVSVLTDCPHRERLGWLEEDHLNGPSLRYNFNLDQLYRKIENDMSDSQTSDGLVPDIAPEYVVFDGGFRDSPEWGSAVALVPWQQYLFTGDPSLLVSHYDQIKQYVDYLSSKAQGHILDYGLADWNAIGKDNPGTPAALTATAFYYEDATILSKCAELRGDTGEAKTYSALAKSIKTAFNQKFWNDQTCSYSSGNDTSNAIPYVMGLAPDEKRDELVSNIVKYIQARDNSFTAGDVGYRYVLQALALGGRSDVVFDMNNQSSHPGYGMQIALGATSLTESWNGDPTSSQNHFMLGQINEWFFAELAGIQIDPDAPGFKNIIINPSPVGDITRVIASYNSVHGKISVSWVKSGTSFKLYVSIPANTSATIYLPATDPNSVREGDQSVEAKSGIRFIRREIGRSIYRVGSGDYTFTSR